MDEIREIECVLWKQRKAIPLNQKELSVYITQLERRLLHWNKEWSLIIN